MKKSAFIAGMAAIVLVFGLLKAVAATVARPTATVAGAQILAPCVPSLTGRPAIVRARTTRPRQAVPASKQGTAGRLR